jgi:hypothetical protein
MRIRNSNEVDRKPVVRSHSTTSKVRNIISNRQHQRQSEDANDRAQHQPLSTELSAGYNSPKDIKDGDITTFLTTQYEQNKQKRRQRKAMMRLSSDSSNSEYSIIKPSDSSRTSKANTISINKKLPETPSLKRKGKFHLEKTLRMLESRQGSSSSVDEHVAMMRVTREQIAEGKLEITASPTSQAPLQTAPIYLSSPPHRVRHTRTDSASSKLSSYLGSSADLLDATRREIQSTIRNSAEKALNLDYFSRNEIIDDSSSDESFFCVGENKRLSELDKARRFTDRLHDPWTQGLLEACRLCKKPSPKGLRSLCKECENRFKRPKPWVFPEDEEIKPTPPLKIKKNIGPSEEEIVGSPVGTDSAWSQDAFGSDAKLSQRSGHKPIAHTAKLHLSKHADIQYESANPFERWQNSDVRHAYQANEEEIFKWSPTLIRDENFTDQR